MLSRGGPSLPALIVHPDVTARGEHRQEGGVAGLIAPAALDAAAARVGSGCRVQSRLNSVWRGQAEPETEAPRTDASETGHPAEVRLDAAGLVQGSMSIARPMGT